MFVSTRQRQKQPDRRGLRDRQATRKSHRANGSCSRYLLRCGQLKEMEKKQRAVHGHITVLRRSVVKSIVCNFLNLISFHAQTCIDHGREHGFTEAPWHGGRALSALTRTRSLRPAHRGPRKAGAGAAPGLCASTLKEMVFRPARMWAGGVAGRRRRWPHRSGAPRSL